MNLQSAIRETFSSQPHRGELAPTGMLDRMAAFGLVLAGVLYIVFDTFGGLIRGVFGGIGLTPILYLPAAVAIPALLANVLSRIGDPRTATPIVLVLAFFVIECVISLMLGRAPGAIAFELYVLLAGFVMASLVQRHMQDRIIDAMVPMFYFAVAGVLLNIFIRFPWADATFEVMGVQRDAARDWTAFGQSRLAGFSRASYNASSQIFLAYCVVEHRIRSLVWRSIWWAVGLIAVYYTTSKSPLLAMILLPGTYFVVGRTREVGAARRKLFANLVMGFWVLLIFVGPFLAMTFGNELYPEGTGTGRGYSSLADRVLNTWPNAIAMIDWRNPVNWIVGRGLGGIGSAQTMFEPDIANPGDNMAIYLFVTFGLASLLFAYLIFRGGLRAIASGGRGRRDFVLIVAMLGIGTAASVMEAPIPVMVFALAVARYQSRRTASESETARTGGRRRVRYSRSRASSGAVSPQAN